MGLVVVVIVVAVVGGGWNLCVGPHQALHLFDMTFAGREVTVLKTPKSLCNA